MTSASRDAPVQPASSSWVTGPWMRTPSGAGLAEALGQVDEPGAHASHGVLGDELDELAVGLDEAAGEHPQQDDRDPGRVVEVGHEGVLADGEDLDRLDGGHRGRPRRAAEGRHLADEVAGLAHVEQRLAPGRRRDADLHPPLEDEQDGVAGVALVEERRRRPDSGAGRRAPAARRAGRGASASRKDGAARDRSSRRPTVRGV